MQFAICDANEDGRRLAAILRVMLLTFILIAGPARASSFQVNPVSVELAQGRGSASLSVSNRDSLPVSIRVRLMRWTQENGEDVYAESDDLIASPPIFTVAPGGRQVLRVGPRRGVATGAYRIILEEIPGPAREGTAIRVVLRVNLPFYTVPESGGRPDLSWTAWRGADGDLVVEGRNAGARHSQIVRIDSVDAAGQGRTLSSLMGVVLPGSARRWNVGPRPDIRVGEDLNLRIRNARGETSQARIVLERR
jgi:fimbrial chaperone protein